MKKKLTQKSLFQSLEDAISTIPDQRSQNHNTHAIPDAIFVPFSSAILNPKKI